MGPGAFPGCRAPRSLRPSMSSLPSASSLRQEFLLEPSAPLAASSDGLAFGACPWGEGGQRLGARHLSQDAPGPHPAPQGAPPRDVSLGLAALALPPLLPALGWKQWRSENVLGA